MTLKDRGFRAGDYVCHFKGDFYRIIGLATQTETEEKLVIYQAQKPPYGLFARPEEMFCSEVDKDKYPDVKQKYRMEKAAILVQG